MRGNMKDHFDPPYRDFRTSVEKIDKNLSHVKFQQEQFLFEDFFVEFIVPNIFAKKIGSLNPYP